MHKEVILAEHAGFCFGASKAVEALSDSIELPIPIYTFGPILNNRKIVEDFSQKGVKVIDNIDEIDSLPKGKIIIRSHGVSREIYEKLINSIHEIHDATCPFVKRIHRIVEEESKKGNIIVVIGNPNHPEVKGIVGWSTNTFYVLETQEDVMSFRVNENEKITIVAQTTFNRKKFQEFLEILEKNCYNMHVMNTICDATSIRQTEAECLSNKADTMIVIGDKESSNSRKLYEICQAKCKQTYFVESWDELKELSFNAEGLTGITAGASTPKYIIEEVQSHVRNDV